MQKKYNRFNKIKIIKKVKEKKVKKKEIPRTAKTQCRGGGL